MCCRVSYGHGERSSAEAGFRGDVVSRSYGEAVDEEGGVWVEFVPCVVGGGAVLAVGVCACLFHSPGAEPVYSHPEG